MASVTEMVFQPVWDRIGAAARAIAAHLSAADPHPQYTTDERVDDRVASLLVAGANITLTYNDPANTLTIAASGGGGGGGTKGEVTLNFGAAPGTNVTTVVVPEVAVAANSAITLFVSGNDSTADHNAYEHSLLPMMGGFSVTPISLTAGVGFTAQASTDLRLTGLVKCRYVLV